MVRNGDRKEVEERERKPEYRLQYEYIYQNSSNSTMKICHLSVNKFYLK